MFLNSFFKNNKTYDLTVQTRSQTFINSVSGPVVWTDYEKVDCILYRGSISGSLISEKFKADVEATALVKPGVLSMQEVGDDSRLRISDDLFTGAVNNAGGYTAGTLTIVVDSFTDSSGPIKKGDTFTIAAETGFPTHTVASTTKTSSLTTGITFTNAIATGGVLDDAVISLTPVLGYYSVISPDNIAGQNKVLMIPLKEWK